MKRTDLVQFVFVKEGWWGQATVEMTAQQGGKGKCAQRARVPHSPAVLTLKRKATMQLFNPPELEQMFSVLKVYKTSQHSW